MKTVLAFFNQPTAADLLRVGLFNFGLMKLIKLVRQNELQTPEDELNSPTT